MKNKFDHRQREQYHTAMKRLRLVTTQWRFCFVGQARLVSSSDLQQFG